MVLSNISFIVFAGIGMLLLVGVIFVIQDARAYRRREEEYTNRKNALRNVPSSFDHEHEPA